MSETHTNAGFKLGTFSAAGCPPFAGILRGDRVLALHALQRVADAGGLPLTGSDSVFALLQNWDSNFAALTEALALAHALDPRDWVPVSSLKVHAPIDLPRQIFCTGANYFKHVVDLLVDMGPGANPGTEGMGPAELRAYAENLMNERARTGTPYVFGKIPSAVTGPHDQVILPAQARQPDWELELAVVIGKPARHVKREQAAEYIAGYTIANDITSRDLIWCKDPKAMGTDWISSKNSPTFLPLGPYLVPAAFVADPQALQLVLKLNGETMQNESTSDMIFDIARQVEYISSRVQLWPGDVICTGSPAGNGTHYGRYLQDGDVMEASITGLGEQRNACVAETHTR
jgi:2-keto-4-pentenoate hydratase/2-oxohepta-3-ene-1,7-dioic acid hydratase in catechol pathway